MRSPNDADIQVIDLTNRCFKRCSSCTRDVAHQVETKEMTPEMFRKALNSLKGWWKPGKVIGLIGGEPTLNKHFAEICKIFREEFNPGVTTHGRLPIPDMNAFAQERLFDRSNGKGLWTSFGPKFMTHAEDIYDTFSHWNSNDHSEGGLHQTSLVDAKEMCEALHIPWSEWPKWRDRCWLQSSWSGTITPRGRAYFCERAGMLDELYNDGGLGWDIEKEPDWWKRKPEEFGEQLSICDMCSLALPGPSQVDSLERDIIGKDHRIRLQMLGSPAIKRGNFEQFDPATHIERRTIDRKDNYVAESGRRVAVDNEFIKPRKTTLVVVCVGRAEHLKKTLAHNAKLVDEIVVVTSFEDLATIDVLQANPNSDGKVRLVMSDRCYENEDTFNKGKMINDGVKAIKDPDWIILADADVYLNPKLPEFIKGHSFNPGVLYGTERYDFTKGEIDTVLESVQILPDRKNPGLHECAKHLQFERRGAIGVNAEPNGYFQMFHHRAQAIRDRWPNVMSEAFCSAGSVDSWFLQQFDPGKRVLCPDIAVVHIEHGPRGTLWNGEYIAKRRGWRQLGIITPKGEFALVPGEVAHRGAVVRLTSTLDEKVSFVHGIYDGDSFPERIVRMENGRLLFEGKDTNGCHIHVAYYHEG